MATRGHLGGGLHPPARWRSGISKLLVGLALPATIAVGALNWFLRLVDSSFPASLLRLTGAVSTGLAVGLIVHLAVERLARPGDEHDRLARSIVEAARKARVDGQHRAVLELRTSSSRLLQLLGKWSERAELGEIALESSRIEQDRLAQASILIDDLGYNVLKLDQVQRASDGVEAGIAILNNMLQHAPESRIERDQLLDLRAKAHRHMAAIKCGTNDFRGARLALEAARADARALSAPLAADAMAKLDYAEAYVLDKELAFRVSLNGPLVLDAQTVRQLETAAASCRAAIKTFHDRANLEWEARAASLLPALLRRCAPDWQVREAEARAQTIRQQQARYRKTLRE